MRLLVCRGGLRGCGSGGNNDVQCNWLFSLPCSRVSVSSSSCFVLCFVYRSVPGLSMVCFSFLSALSLATRRDAGSGLCMESHEAMDQTFCPGYVVWQALQSKTVGWLLNSFVFRRRPSMGPPMGRELGELGRGTLGVKRTKKEKERERERAHQNHLHVFGPSPPKKALST